MKKNTKDAIIVTLGIILALLGDEIFSRIFNF
jgi:hypothetical protein